MHFLSEVQILKNRRGWTLCSVRLPENGPSERPAVGSSRHQELQNPPEPGGPRRRATRTESGPAGRPAGRRSGRTASCLCLPAARRNLCRHSNSKLLQLQVWIHKQKTAFRPDFIVTVQGRILPGQNRRVGPLMPHSFRHVISCWRRLCVHLNVWCDI